MPSPHHPVRYHQVGEYWLDLSGLRDTGLCPAAYIGLDSQSDKLAGMVCNPYLYVQVDEMTKELSVPYCLQGALLFNCAMALVISSLLHRTMPPPIRVENALTAFLILDMGKMWADSKATKNGLRRGTFWIAAQTQQNLQDLAGSDVCFPICIFVIFDIFVYICLY